MPLSTPGSVDDNVIPFRSRPHVKCYHCDYPMSRQKDGNFRCVVPTCGKGYLKAHRGIQVRYEGNSVIYESGDDPNQ